MACAFKKRNAVCHILNMELLNVLEHIDEEAKILTTRSTGSYKLWMPKRVVFTPEALEEPYGQKIFNRVKQLNLNTDILKKNRITGLRGETETGNV